MKEQKELIYYNLGKRDCIAEILMSYRIDGVTTILKLAKEYYDSNPHAKWIIDNNDSEKTSTAPN